MTGRTFSSNISGENCFDFLRFLFAFSVFCSHFAELTENQFKWPISSATGVAGFFIISGFLITRSYYNSTHLFDYALKRVKRIIPAYFLIVILCAFFLSLVSSLPFNEYFSSKEFFRYLAANLSFLNFVQPTLPGVFETNYLPFINGSLWTIKVELSLYAFIPLLVVFIKKKPIKLFVFFYVISFVFSFIMLYFYEKLHNEFILLLRKQFLGQIIYFISGVILLFYFDEIKAKIKWVYPAALFIFIARYYVDFLIVNFLHPFCFAVLIVYFAYHVRKLSVFSRYGDCSYGFYLFHYPVIQVFVHFGWLKQNPVFLFIGCFLTILVLSYFSWHLLEKRFLKRRFLFDGKNAG